MLWITSALTAIAVLVALPALIIAAQVIVAALPIARSPRPPHSDRVAPNQPVRPVVAVLVPAHNEALGIRGTIESIAAQMAPGDRLVVVADNCTDATAEIAR